METYPKFTKQEYTFKKKDFRNEKIANHRLQNKFIDDLKNNGMFKTIHTKASTPTTDNELAKKFGFKTMPDLQDYIVRDPKVAFIKFMSLFKERNLEPVDYLEYWLFACLLIVGSEMTDAIFSKHFVDNTKKIIKKEGKYEISS